MNERLASTLTGRSTPGRAGEGDGGRAGDDAARGGDRGGARLSLPGRQLGPLVDGRRQGPGGRLGDVLFPLQRRHLDGVRFQ